MILGSIAKVPLNLISQMGKAEGELYHLTEAEVRKREEKIGSKRDIQIEEGRIRGIVWMLQMLHITLASLRDAVKNVLADFAP